MAFRVPTFNLLCNVWSGTAASPPLAPAGAPRIVGVPCNLRVGRIIEDAAPYGVQLSVAALTDIRFTGLGGLRGDNVEVPAGSGRFYQVYTGDDVGKGFPNEYRLFGLSKVSFQAIWPVPFP
jgi:hypothetical protein